MESFLCARCFFLLLCSFLLFFALSSAHSFRCEKRATRVLRFCGRQAQRRGMVAAKLYGCDVLLVVHPLRRRCESKVVASGTSPHPLTCCCLPPARVASMFYALCCAQRLRSDSNSNCSSGFGFEFGFGFRFGFSISSVWAEFGVDRDWDGDWHWDWDWA